MLIVGRRLEPKRSHYDFVVAGGCLGRACGHGDGLAPARTRWRGRVARPRRLLRRRGHDLLDRGRPDGWPLDRDPLPLETSRPGLFAAGDVRHGSTKRVAGWVGEGAMAAALASHRLAELGVVV